MSTKAFCPCGGGSNLILGIGTENQILFLITPAAIKFFHQILKNCHFGVKIDSLSTQMDLYDPYKSPHTISQGNFNFPRSTNKIPYFDEISTSRRKIVNLMKDLKYEHQSIFPLWGRVKLNFRDGYRKPHIYSKNCSRYQFFSSNTQKMTLWCKKKKNHYPPRCICIPHIWSPT